MRSTDELNDRTSIREGSYAGTEADECKRGGVIQTAAKRLSTTGNTALPDEKVLFYGARGRVGRSQPVGTINRTAHIASRFMSVTVPKSLDYGYAGTVHQANGARLDRRFMLATPGMERHLACVRMTCQREGRAQSAPRRLEGFRGSQRMFHGATRTIRSLRAAARWKPHARTDSSTIIDGVRWCLIESHRKS